MRSFVFAGTDREGFVDHMFGRDDKNDKNRREPCQVLAPIVFEIYPIPRMWLSKVFLSPVQSDADTEINIFACLCPHPNQEISASHRARA